VQSSVGALTIHIAGTTPASEFSAMTISGAATFGGSLSVMFVDGFIPSPGDTFAFISAGSVNGAFATENLPSIPGLQFEVLYEENAVRLIVAADFLEGDCNCDGSFDPDDIECFVVALLDAAQFPGCDVSRVDLNLDSMVNGADVQIFVNEILE